MPYATANDGVRLYYEETGGGAPLIFVHEFAGDHRSWEPQIRFFARRYRCITYDARGYALSDTPEDQGKYSQASARDDIIAVLDHLKIDRAHIAGLSMGGFATLHAGLGYPKRARSLVIAGCGYGAAPDAREKFIADCAATADMFEREGIAAATKKYTAGPARVQYQDKDPRGRPVDRAAHRAHDQPRGAGGFQPRRARVPDLGRAGPLGRARSALGLRRRARPQRVIIANRKEAIMRVLFALLFLGLAHPVAAQTDAYPNRPIRIMVTVPPGGAADFIARTVGARL